MPEQRDVTALKLSHFLGIFHRWDYIFPDTDGPHFITPYKRCRVCGEEHPDGNPARWGIGMDGNWFYDEADYGI
jgi:hypothetical protein